MWPRAQELWIILCALLACAGWIFSAFSVLGGPAYIAFFCVLGAGILLLGRKLGLPKTHWRRDLRKTARRFRRLPAFLYLCLFGGSLIGALAYPTIHFDSLSYRLPRVLHWLAEGKWHWINTSDTRMNVVASATEWLWAPLMLLTDAERVLSITNLISYCFLPGLVYAFFVHVGVRRRLAWWWMWILPSALCYALQAGSLATDAYATVFSLAAVVYALKAGQSRNPYFLCVSILAVGFATGTKQTNLILVPLWGLAAMTAWRVALARPVVVTCAGAVALLASFLPNAIGNIKYAGYWNGFALPPHSKFWGVIGNAFALPLENLMPPIFPAAREWNAATLRFLETPFGSNFKGFEHFAELYRGASENNVGLGLTTCLLLLAGLAGVAKVRRQREPSAQKNAALPNAIRIGLLVSPWFLVLIYMAEVMISRSARYLCFFYPFLFAGILVVSGRPDRFRWWRVGVYVSMLVSLATLGLLRQRPLLPVPLVADVVERFVSKSLADRTRHAFSFVSSVRDIIEGFHNALPPETKVAAYICEAGNLEIALWHPYGSRRVWRYGAKDCLEPGFDEDLRRKRVEYAILDSESLSRTKPSTLDEWLALHNAEVVFSKGMPTEPELPAREVWLVRFKR